MDTTQTTSLRNQFNTEALGKFGQILMTRNDISRKSKLKWGNYESISTAIFLLLIILI